MNNLLLKQALEKPNNMAFICDDITVTYKESWERVLDLKSMLDVGGVEAGDKVALITEEPLEFVHMFMAISLCDAIIIPVYLKSGIEKINKLLKYFKIKYVFTQEDAVGDMLDGSYNPISTNEKSNYFLFCNKNLTLDESLKDAKLILFSSGTTSFPKAVMLSKNNICNGVQREHNKKLNNGLPILHKVPPKRDYGRYFCIMAEKGGTSHGGLTEKLSPFFHAKKQ